MQAYVGFLVAEPHKHPVIIKTLIGIAGHLEIVGAFRCARRGSLYGSSHLRQAALRLTRTARDVIVHVPDFALCHRLSFLVQTQDCLPLGNSRIAGTPLPGALSSAPPGARSSLQKSSRMLGRHRDKIRTNTRDWIAPGAKTNQDWPRSRRRRSPSKGVTGPVHLRRYCTSIAETIASPLVGLNSRTTMRSLAFTSKCC